MSVKTKENVSLCECVHSEREREGEMALQAVDGFAQNYQGCTDIDFMSVLLVF